MELEQIIGIIVSAAPALAAILGCIISFIKNKAVCTSIVDSFESVRKEVMDTKQYEDLKIQLKLAHKENYELKKKMNELMTKVDHIVRREDE